MKELRPSLVVVPATVIQDLEALGGRGGRNGERGGEADIIWAGVGDKRKPLLLVFKSALLRTYCSVGSK